MLQTSDKSLVDEREFLFHGDRQDYQVVFDSGCQLKDLWTIPLGGFLLLFLLYFQHFTPSQNQNCYLFSLHKSIVSQTIYNEEAK